MIKTYLKNNGYDGAELEKYNTSQLLEMYQNHISKEIHIFQTFLNQNHALTLAPIKDHAIQQELRTKISAVKKKFSKIYDLIDTYMGYYDYEEFLEILCVQLSNIPATKIKKALQIKYHQIQQVWLEGLEDQLQDLPAEERATLMQYYQRHQNDFSKLEKVYEDSKNPAYIQKLKKIAEDKLMVVKNFMPSLMEENYPAYYNGTPKKLELIEKISKLTNSYPKKYLKTLMISQLELLESDIIEQNQREIQDKKLFQKYTKAFLESLNSMEDNDFSKVCLDAISELNSEQLQRVVSFLASKNKFFLTRFEALTKGFKSIIKTKII
ncbi:hypothetical protein [Helicobacter sp. 12S02634-8]|uniref:hypothetical protein n=1 Tax=Helicobacter sp. 12S02634-8 TaxID=1476199 RepID=UPI001179D0E0|nr:hypothetical protein [Helicobacter sp. 12S02634-8]